MGGFPAGLSPVGRLPSPASLPRSAAAVSSSHASSHASIFSEGWNSHQHLLPGGPFRWKPCPWLTLSLGLGEWKDVACCQVSTASLQTRAALRGTLPGFSDQQSQQKECWQRFTLQGNPEELLAGVAPEGRGRLGSRTQGESARHPSW